VVFVDAFDVLFLPSLPLLPLRFTTMRTDLVFGAEVSCAPDRGLAPLYPEALRGSRVFLNSGTYAGRASDVL
ncbi:unnamed protein product, partial [Discosporangium mesarthrocarpum]